MVQRRLAVRTPRKEKVWAHVQSDFVTLTSSPGGQVISDLLSGYRTDMGILQTLKLTVMRIVGKIAIGNNSTATATTYWSANLGIAWVTSAIAALSPGDGSIPDPGVAGIREAEWLQRWWLIGLTVPSRLVLYAAEGQNGGLIEFDVKQMRKQPTPDHRLVLISNSTAGAAEDGLVAFNLDIMVAVP